MNIPDMRKENGELKWWVILIIVLISLRIGNIIYSKFYDIRQNKRIEKIKEQMALIGLGKKQITDGLSKETPLKSEKYTEIDMLYEIQMWLFGLKNKILSAILF